MISLELDYYVQNRQICQIKRSLSCSKALAKFILSVRDEGEDFYKEIGPWKVLQFLAEQQEGAFNA